MSGDFSYYSCKNTQLWIFGNVFNSKRGVGCTSTVTGEWNSKNVLCIYHLWPKLPVASLHMFPSVPTFPEGTRKNSNHHHLDTIEVNHFGALQDEAWLCSLSSSGRGQLQLEQKSNLSSRNQIFWFFQPKLLHVEIPKAKRWDVRHILLDLAISQCNFPIKLNLWPAPSPSSMRVGRTSGFERLMDAEHLHWLREGQGMWDGWARNTPGQTEGTSMQISALSPWLPLIPSKQCSGIRTEWLLQGSKLWASLPWGTCIKLVPDCGF